MATYPQDFPLAESVEVVQILRQNKVAEKKAVFARHLWTLQGYAMKATLGDPDNPTAKVDLPPDLSLFSVKPDGFDALVELEKLNTALSGEVAAQVQVPWKLILKWALEELVTVVAAA